MTYCVGLRVRAGMVLIADTRTNAGIDNISVYKKLHTLADDGERSIYAATAGSLSVTQSMISLLAEGLPPNDDSGIPRTIAAQPTMFRVAQLVGEALKTAREAVGEAVAGTKINPRASVLLGGRIGARPGGVALTTPEPTEACTPDSGPADDGLSLFLVYNEGNFIECQPDAPFLQVGELKYGKPMLDRSLDYDTPLDEAVKLALISFDATMRSNLSVGLPLDVVIVPCNAAADKITLRIAPDDPYFRGLSTDWGRMLNEARLAIEGPPFMAGLEPSASVLRVDE